MTGSIQPPLVQMYGRTKGCMYPWMLVLSSGHARVVREAPTSSLTFPGARRRDPSHPIGPHAQSRLAVPQECSAEAGVT